MALGVSGSNGGIDERGAAMVSDQPTHMWADAPEHPAEVSYFVNNACNLNCRHCYVGYVEQHGSLSIDEWKEAFNDLIEAGAHTFGNVGKEPLLSWPTTIGLLDYFKEQRNTRPHLRYGLVTNLTLLDDNRAAEIAAALPNYIDVSLDGDKATHDAIRGHGTYSTTMDNLTRLVEVGLGDRIFISFTLHRENVGTVSALVEALHNKGIRRLLISPYISLDPKDPLLLPEAMATRWIKDCLDGSVVDFRRCNGMRLYFKNDFSTSRHVMNSWVQSGIIRLDDLRIDSYGVMFCKYEVGDSTLYFNYQVRNDFPSRAIRISHDGHIGSCLDMFYEDYRSRAIGNIRKQPILSILSKSCNTECCAVAAVG